MILLYPVSLLMALVVWARETLYRLHILKSYKVQTQVLSVGNLTFGGTGKTPSVDFLLSQLKTRKKIAVISRGYGRTTTGFYKVDPNQPNATSLYGDEPVLQAINHPDVPIYVCEDRVHGCEQIEKDGKFDLIIADDAFQHLKLQRDLDIVVVDATEHPTHYFYPPAGRARNSLSYLKRADFVFLTKTNLCRSDDMTWIKKKLKKYKVIEFESRIDGILDLKSGRHLETLIKEASLISGIGKPKNFEESLRKSLGINIKKHYVFKDHHSYTPEDIAAIKEDLQGQIVITTEKDAVKLREYTDSLNLAVTKLKFVSKNSNELEKLYEALH